MQHLSQQAQRDLSTGSRSLPGHLPIAGWLVVAALAVACIAGFAVTLLTGQERAALAVLGMFDEQHVAFFNGLEIARMVIYTLCALVIIWRQPYDAIVLCTATVLIAAGAFIPSATEALALNAGSPLPEEFSNTVIVVALLYLIFPDGRLVPRWGWLLIVFWAIWSLVISLFPQSQLDPARWPPRLQFARAMGWLACGLAAQLYRYQRVAGPTQRQQTRWVLIGAAITFGAALGFVLIPLLLPALVSSQEALRQYAQAGGTLRTLLMLALPISMAVAVLRYRLWDVDPLLSRTLLYGALTLSIALIYALVVGGLSLIFQTSAHALIALVATGVTAVLFQWLRERLQRGINRLFYGERDEPYAALARLGQRLEDTLAPQTVLPTLVEAIAQALRSPYVGIALHQDQALLLAAEYPPKPYRRLPPEQLQTLPLTHQGQLIGQLQVAPREPGERLSGGDLQLLADLARQAGAAVRAFQLNQELQHTLAELQQSRERLVTAREAERRRLRRDLHDGVGPTLASLIQRIDRVRGLIRTDPDAADQVLTDLKGLTRGALTDIRSLVYALRPPALDEFGLVGALRQHIAQTSTSALKVLLIAPDEPLAVSAAVEVAAYRIAMEALTNAARHAQATTCHLRLLIEEFPGQRHLLIEICDDGMGIAADRQVGVGLTAMNERAAELGGTLTIEPNSPHGTRVIALLPLGG